MGRESAEKKLKAATATSSVATTGEKIKLDETNKKDFIFRSPILPDQESKAREICLQNIQKDFDFIESRGYEEFFKQHSQQQNDEDQEDELSEVARRENLGAAIEGSPRDYQIFMLEQAKKENAIVHLGTGMGKTLISIMLIKEYLSRTNSNKDKEHILFLVPSVALAVQHTDTLRANLACIVETACHTSSSSSKAREAIVDADVVVATHGAALDLLRHYPDVISMPKVKLFVLDECHYATGKHNYATILEKFYHPLPKDSRPRVLGLTASPLINVAIRTTETELQMLLASFERIMDARLFGFPTDVTAKALEPCNQTEDRKYVGYVKEAEETVIPYFSGSDKFSTKLPPIEKWSLHRSRSKEMDQLQKLCDDVGLQVTAVYASTLIREVSRNDFERESYGQFRRLKNCLRDIANHLTTMITNGEAGPHGGHTEKMRILEDLLTRVVKPRNQSPESNQAPVGIVFVERRITAIALCKYFCERQKEEEENKASHNPMELQEGGNETEKSEPMCEQIHGSNIVDSNKNAQSQPALEPMTNAGIFDDAENDDSLDFFYSNHILQREKACTSDSELGQKDDTKIVRNECLETRDAPVGADGSFSGKASIRCDVVVRQATQIFKYLGRHHQMNKIKQEDLIDDWVHQTKAIRNVISKLRRRETNVLVATSVVEEGVDVEACSFVISFDGLKTMKSYIQMKGRARQKNAKFFVFSDGNPCESQPLSLEDAQVVEKIIYHFIVRREKENPIEPFFTLGDFDDVPHASDEETVMHCEEYKTAMGIVDLTSSKSLINRFALSVPLDSSCRMSKEATTLHMPIYMENKLILPSHIPPGVREVHLPNLYFTQNKKRKQSLMALAACVRLHKLGLLNDRLLPLSDDDMKRWLLDKTLTDLPSCDLRPTPKFSPDRSVHIYKIVQTGRLFCQEEKTLMSEGRSLALISLVSLPERLPSGFFDHIELDRIDYKFEYHGATKLSDLQWKELTQFHTIVFNARWIRRRKKSEYFAFEEESLSSGNKVFPAHLVGYVRSDNAIDWGNIRKVISDNSRSYEDREKSVNSVGDISFAPRVWRPKYSPNASYITLGPSGKCCDDDFPGDNFETYREYFKKRYSIDLRPKGNLILAKRMWDFPRGRYRGQLKNKNSKLKIMSTVDLPQEVCVEAMVADPLVMLHSIMLPFILYHLERQMTAVSFTQHCAQYFPILGKYLSKLPIDSIVEALSAKSCSTGVNYDRLEWLGDAVLKLIHTDALLKWERTFYLHEGYLSMLRSAMGSNDRLKDIAKQTCIDDFILLTPMSRGHWRPCGLQLRGQKKHLDAASAETQIKWKPSGKVCADVVEAILGLLYVEFGLDIAAHSACELGVSFQHGDADGSLRQRSDEMFDPHLVQFASSFLGISNFNNPLLLVEATTHQSCLHKPVPSYQRLEWIGDAVLCLAAREWLFRKKEKIAVSKLVVLETTLVCNESLAFIGFTKGLHRFIDHRDARLPARFESFQRDLDSMGRGLWSTDPPKIIPDVVEALIGVAHVDQGFRRGQMSALLIVQPILNSISSFSRYSMKDVIGIVHPKQQLFEITNGIVRVRAYKDSIHRRQSLSCPVWDCSEGKISSGFGQNRYVGVVSCKEIVIAAVVELSARAATNVACSLAIDLFNSNPSLITKLEDIQSTVAESDESD